MITPSSCEDSLNGQIQGDTWYGGLRSWAERYRFFILFLILLLGLSFRIVLVQTRNAITHDEIMSYLSATGHLQAYETTVAEKRPPCGAWATAVQWKRFLAIETPFCFETIRLDSATMDYHPPLYFWLLHVWTLLTGVGLGTGVALNLILASCTSVALYLLACHVFKNRVEGLVVVWVWLLSPAVIGTSLLVRQYELLALCTVLLAWRLERPEMGVAPSARKEFILLMLLTAAGLLTHFNYIIVVAGCVVYQLWQYSVQRRRRLLLPVGAMFCGGMVSAILNPYFYRSFLLLQDRGGAWDVESFVQRIGRVVSGLLGFVLPERIWMDLGNRVSPVVITAGLLFLAGVLLVCRLRGMRGGRDRLVPRAQGQNIGLSLFMLCWMAIGLIGQYLSCKSPPQAMGGRYLSPLWPLVAMGVVMGLHRGVNQRMRWMLGVAVCLCLFLGDVARASHSIGLARRNPSFAEFLGKYDRVVTDRLANGFFLRILWYAPDNQPVYGGTQEDLCAHVDPVSNAAGNVLFISEFGGSNTRAKRDTILERWRHSGSVDEIDGGYWDLDYVGVYHAHPNK